MLRRIPEKMDPALYYKTFRPYIRFFENVVYEGVETGPLDFRGETGAQSSIMPTARGADEDSASAVDVDQSSRRDAKFHAGGASRGDRRSAESAAAAPAGREGAVQQRAGSDGRVPRNRTSATPTNTSTSESPTRAAPAARPTCNGSRNSSPKHWPIAFARTPPKTSRGRPYSYRSASIGSSREAFQAG